MPKSYHQLIKETLKRIPLGKVATYGQIAAIAGNPYGAREVARVLHSSSRKDNLPWHRVINRLGRISLSRNQGYEEQRRLLEVEGVEFGLKDTIDFEKYLWQPADNE
jgi:methylated-DNA-protein-cysteine methyltransferase-like protein